MKTPFAAAVLIVAFSASAQADINVRFIEGAPKDRFEISASSDCFNKPLSMVIALEGSAGGLIFDTTESGAGVEVFQPFEVVAGQALLKDTPSVADGDKSLELRLTQLPKGQMVAFTIDVDDTGGAREITVSGAEIKGAMVAAASDDGAYSALFDARAQARLDSGTC